jgi:hypothetical protein
MTTKQTSKASNNVRTLKRRETDTIDHDTQKPIDKPTLTELNAESKKLPDYKKLGQKLFATVRDGQNKLRNVLLAIFEEVGTTDIDGYNAIAGHYADGYTNPDTKKNMKSALNAIFKAYCKDSETFLNGNGELKGMRDETTYIGHWQKLAREIVGKRQTGGKVKKELTETERNTIIDKVEEFATPPQAAAVINTAINKLNGEFRMSLIVTLIAATIEDEHAEEIFRKWAESAYFEANKTLNRVQEARDKANATTEAVKNNVPVAA